MMEKRNLFRDKKAQGLSVNAIILIILGLVVLVALIIGFTFGFQGLKDRFSTSNNVGTIVSACQTACATNVQYDFCTSQRDLKADNGVQVNDATCFYLAQNRTEFGIEKCGTISCGNSVLLFDTPQNAVGGLVKFKDQADLDSQKTSVCSKTVNIGSLSSSINTEGKTVYGMSEDGKTLLSINCEVTP